MGQGGNGGVGGKNGEEKKATCHVVSIPVVFLPAYTKKWSTHWAGSRGKKPDGRNGENNKNAAGQITPNVVSNKLTSDVVDDYKSFLV